jgi:hypothetical protein
LRPSQTAPTSVRLWQWPNLLGIDAALIAATWQLALADARGQLLPVAACGVLALSVWLTYMADRLFDVACRPAEQLLSARHSFAKRQARRLWPIWGGVLASNLMLALLGLSLDSLKKGAWLLAFCIGYTLLNQLLSRRFFPKELCVALIFTGGVVVFQDRPYPWDFALFFALLCLLNCLIIGAKEKIIDTTMQVHSIAQFVAERWLGGAALGLHLLVILVAPPGAVAMSSSFLILGLLHLLRGRLKVEKFRVLADTCLFIPPILWLLS